MIPHAGIWNRLRWMQEAFGLSANDRVLQKTPFSFDVSVWEFFWPLMTGARLVMARPGGHQESRYLREVMAQAEISVVHFVPSMLRQFVGEEEKEELQRLRLVVSSGEALSQELQEEYLERAAGVVLANLYGPTEASVDVTWWECERESERGAVPIGRPIANTQIYILDQEQEAVAVGVVGEIYIGGAGVGRGYLGRPELTAERFQPDRYSRRAGARWYRTGDLGRYRADGSIEYVGRLDEQVKLRGYRIELGEIEAVLGSHASVAESVVLLRRDEERLVAYVVSSTAELNMAELRSYLAERLPGYMVPSAWVLLEQLPLTPNGKVDRRALPAPSGARPSLRSAFVAPRTQLEEVLCNMWSRILRVEKIGVEDDFFELGGHSLLATQLISELQELFPTPVPLLALFFEKPTVAGLTAAIVGSQLDEDARKLVQGLEAERILQD